MIPEPVRGREVAQIRIASIADKATTERLVAPLREIGPMLMDTLDALPFTQASSIFTDPPQPHEYYGTGIFLNGLNKSAMQALLELAGKASAVVQLNHLGGAIAGSAPNAIGHRDARYFLRLVSDPGSRALLDGVFAALAPFASGHAMNFMFGPTGADQVRSAFAADTYKRLSALKATYDPANLFRFNNNIIP
ncbi:BBE domain-containing protein [Fodinicola feengrottensis]|uniref:BBE domain-containing protein n=1 Tax=Fodinicola feengrottensis TaxID=435914 RepID=UPI00244337A7|nr:BBE domain-containing protein [Fodinicola feengrottensis]